MANIKVNDLLELNPAGAELFNDSESFMKELSEESEQMEVIGGYSPYVEYCLFGTCNLTGAISSNTVVIVFNK